MPTKIPYAQETINPVKTVINDELRGYHCTKISEGCARCYAEKMNLNDGFYPWANGLPYDDRKYEYGLDDDVLARVRRWRKPRRVFVQSMSDLFHPDVPDVLIIYLLHFLAQYTRHTFLLLTKRPGRMKEILAAAFPGGVPRHIWLGVTAENQARADERIPVLLSIPAAVRFVSIEPMLGPVNFTVKNTGMMLSRRQGVSLKDWDTLRGKCGHIETAKINWVIVGAETGPGRRTMLPRWARDVKDQCVAAGVPCFLKQAYRNDGTLWRLPELDGRVWNEYPEVNF